MRKVLVVGSRSWDKEELLFSYIDKEWEKEPFILVHGDCQGADTLAAHYLEERGVTIETYPQKWFQKRGGMGRNKQMVDSLNPQTDKVLAFIKDNSRGTMSCINLALDARLPVRIVRNDGSWKDVKRV